MMFTIEVDVSELSPEERKKLDGVGDRLRKPKVGRPPIKFKNIDYIISILAFVGSRKKKGWPSTTSEVQRQKLLLKFVAATAALLKQTPKRGEERTSHVSNGEQGASLRT
jgi:hypothetical protein